MQGLPQPELTAGRAALLRTFQWHAGHADVWRVFRDAQAFELVTAGMVAPFRNASITAVAGIESRGFLLGGASHPPWCRFIAVRKGGSLFPGDKARLTTSALWSASPTCQHRTDLQICPLR
ncbi:hypothetical protein [uncultured Jatrophihabitans sp.]|uniref:hypothetical protein n=1 Tax=uncultured Jatrophihabitans sp. TaxID=1610747 RepID=UPI0035C9C95B